MTKKIILCVTLLVLLCSVFTTFASAMRLSYATDCIAKSTNMVVSSPKGKTLVFSDGDFKKALGVTGFEKITLTSIPNKSQGIMKLAQTEAVAGQVISRSNISKLSFTPANATITETSFTFTCDKLCGGAAITCIIRFCDTANRAPTVSGVSDATLSVWTQKNVTVYGTMDATDPENDELTYIVVSYPRRGNLIVTDAAYGDFRYSPRANFRGNDSFSYVVRDYYGNYSEVATVSIKVAKNVVAKEYSDLKDHRAANAASVMEANSIMQGTISGDGYYFCPDLEVSRSEFVVMAMKACGIKNASALTKTYFDDDADIDETVKSYIATAQRKGYITGTFNGQQLVFKPNESISRAEAAVILARMLGIETTGSKTAFSDSSKVPVWAQESVYALYSLRIISRTSGGNIGAESMLNRGQAAEMLHGAMQYKESLN